MAVNKKWLVRSLKCMVWLIIVLLLLPMLLYLPPVQDFAVKVATKQLEKSTGMKVSIGSFRLGFPLDVKLSDVTVLEASGDTMVRARELVADVKLLPLLNLDVKLEKLRLSDGYYMMTSADSSMVIKVDAGFLEADDKSSMDIRNSRLVLNKTLLRNGRLSLYMNVWKKKPTPPDTVSGKSAPFKIVANNLTLENFSFGMSMLPTIDTLNMSVKSVKIKGALVDLGENLVRWKEAGITDGSFKYLTPTAEYIKTHPAPPSEPSTGPPMRIMGDSIALDAMKVLYGVKNAKPLPGFDANYISLEDVALGLRDFYNESSTVKLPLRRLKARERCGLQITQGSGTVGIDSVGLTLDDVKIKTLFSFVNATADVPFATMQLDERSAMNVVAEGRIGLPDVDAFMPSVKQLTAYVPARKPLVFLIDAKGSLSQLDVKRLNLNMPGVLALKAAGNAGNVLNPRHLTANVKFSGSLSDPQLADRFLAPSQIKVPAFDISGTATARGLVYGADFTLRSTAGDVAAKGNVALTPETYTADVHATGFDVARFVPQAGVGHLTADIHATGRGFNPLSGIAVTDAIVNVKSVEYNKRLLRDIKVEANLSNAGDLTLSASSPNPGLDFSLDGIGTIHKDNYAFDIKARMRDVDLQTLGLSDSICSGSANVALRGTASPGKWLYNVDLNVDNLDWNLPGEYIHLPGGVQASLAADRLSTALKVNSLLTELDFNASAGLHTLIAAFSKAGETISRQIAAKNISIDGISADLPAFNLNLNSSGDGLLSQFLSPQGMTLDTVYASIRKDSLITGDINALNFRSPSVNLDTVRLDLKQRGSLLDYAINVGNRPGTFDEFARVTLRGYVGENRASAYFTQRNIENRQGYKIGVTLAMEDSTITGHITPLNSTIAYMPWKFNDDNYLEFNFLNRHIAANLQAGSSESSVAIKTQPNAQGLEELALNIKNLHVEDFLHMWAFAPPVKGAVNADMHIVYIDKRFEGNGTLGIKDFTYDKVRVGNLDLNLDAGIGLDASTEVNASLLVDGTSAMTAFCNLRERGKGLEPDSVGLSLTRFPLKVANPFLGESVKLAGYLSGNMKMEGSFSAPVLNGFLEFDSVSAYIPIMASGLRFAKDRLDVVNSVVNFTNFNIYGANDNPLSVNGTVDALRFSNMKFDLDLDARNMQVLNTDKRSRGDLFGKIFLNLSAGVKGPMNRLNVDGNVNLLGTTDATYRLNMETSELTAESDADVVKFVNFNDTVRVADEDSVKVSPLNMRIAAALAISPGTQLEVLLSDNGLYKVELSPSANLNYNQNYMGDMNLTGTLTLGNGMVRYGFPVIGDRMFTFDPASTITWRGPVANPVLNITGTDEMRANVTSGDNSRLVNFFITLHVQDALERPKVMFDLSTNDDMTIQNELQSMSPDQRQTQAMNLLITRRYSGMNVKANADIGGNMLYSYLASQLNSWAANHIRGVDLSFGVNQYDKTTNGVTNQETSYSYQVSKSLFNNRFKIQVGGNYSTESSDDELAQNLVSDVSLEYIIKQTQSTDMSVKLFRHTGYESILEGEVTETGVGFVLKRRLESLKNIFNFLRRRKRKPVSEAADSIGVDSAPLPERKITVTNRPKE
ncbi:MAG: translocation/assembly module TamB domain-containing protein [Candidatus Amulumruptor caecigallinarius]|nr:translocation/assembly module TamB domain-containing protein [Candidatus Amulumruptor caecigallinarius]